MANPGTVIAHVVKLVTTLICMKFFKDSYSLRAVEQGWAIRAFQIMLVHSILGIIRYSKFLLIENHLMYCTQQETLKKYKIFSKNILKIITNY